MKTKIEKNRKRKNEKFQRKNICADNSQAFICTTYDLSGWILHIRLNICSLLFE